MSKNYMITILKRPNKPPEIIKIPKRLKSMAKLIDGIIEEIRYEKVIVVYNRNQDDFKLKRNEVFKDLTLKGNILIVGNCEEEGDIRSLKKREIVEYIKKIKYKQKEVQNEVE